VGLYVDEEVEGLLCICVEYTVEGRGWGEFSHGILAVQGVEDGVDVEGLKCSFLGKGAELVANLSMLVKLSGWVRSTSEGCVGMLRAF